MKRDCNKAGKIGWTNEAQETSFLGSSSHFFFWQKLKGKNKPPVIPQLWGVGLWCGEEGGYGNLWVFGDLIEEVFENRFQGLIVATFVQGVQNRH